MPDKVDEYDTIKERFIEITSSAKETELMQYSKFCRLPIFPFQSDKFLKDLERLMYCITRHLMNKRRNFPRLYFLSNEDLMTMVNNASDEIKVQADLVKLFPGISRLEFSLDPIEK
jgi:dynein heavy chain